jgi:hypothetical protein
MRTSLQSDEIGPSRAAESNERIAFLRQNGFGPLIDAIEATTTANGTINKRAVRRRLGINRDDLEKQMRALIWVCTSTS